MTSPETTFVEAFPVPSSRRCCATPSTCKPSIAATLQYTAPKLTPTHAPKQAAKETTPSLPSSDVQGHYHRNGHILEFDLTSLDFSAYASDLKAEVVPHLLSPEGITSPPPRVLNAAFRLFLKHAPATLTDEMLLFASSRAAPPGILIKGLPVDHPLPATPLSSDFSFLAAQSPLANAVILGAMRCMGIPVVHPFTRTTFSTLIPANPDARRWGPLALHTDHINELTRRRTEPSAFALLGLRGDEGCDAWTTVVSHAAVHAAADSDDIALLRGADLYPVSIDKATGVKTRMMKTSLGTVPIWRAVTGTLDEPRFKFFCYDFGMQPGPCVQAVGSDVPGVEEAYYRVFTVAEELVDSVNIQTGDMLVVNNIRCSHGRTAFKPRRVGDPHQRWLAKMSVAFDGWRPPQSAVDASGGFADFPSYAPDEKCALDGIL